MASTPPEPPSAAITPATDVPCESADRSPLPTPPTAVTSTPARTRPRRSGTTVTPVSTTATRAPAPSLNAQTRRASKCPESSGHSDCAGRSRAPGAGNASADRAATRRMAATTPAAIRVLTDPTDRPTNTNIPNQIFAPRCQPSGSARAGRVRNHQHWGRPRNLQPEIAFDPMVAGRRARGRDDIGHRQQLNRGYTWEIRPGSRWATDQHDPAHRRVSVLNVASLVAPTGFEPALPP